MIKKNFLYEGLGFPIIFTKVPVKNIWDELVPDINHRQLQDIVFRTLLCEKIKLSGAHLSFVRHYMELKQEDLAKKLGLSGHSMISKWESKKQNSTGMSSATEAAVRALMREYLHEPHISLQEFIAFLSGDLDEPKPIQIAA